jgi:probable phosphoglycerate mutase
MGAGAVVAAGAVLAAGGDLRRPGERARRRRGGARAPSPGAEPPGAAAGRRGWSLLFADRHPHAGGPEHYAAYLEDAAGFEVELVAESW